MAVETAKEFLQQVRLYDIHINNKLEEKARLEALAKKITSSWSSERVSGSGNQDKLGDTVSKIVDLERDIDRAVDAFIDKKKEVSAVIEKITNAEYCDILYKRYFHNEQWEQIAYEMGYDKRSITRKHGEALMVVKRLLQEEVVPKCP